MNANHSFVSVTVNGRVYFLHIVKRDNLELFFATDFWQWPLDQRETAKCVAEYRAGRFGNAENDLANCAAKV